MNKVELIEAIASDANLTKKDARKALDAFIGATTSSLKSGNRVALVGFGSFSIAKREARRIEFDVTPVIEEAEEGGYIGYIAEIPGVNTQGETIEEVEENLQDALVLVTEARRARIRSIRIRRARSGRNPQTGGAIHIPAKKVVIFKAGADLAKTVV